MYKTKRKHLKMKKAVLILFFLSGTFGFSQHNRNSITNKPYIEVTGTAEKEIIPDEIYISIILKERMVRSKKVTIQQQESDLKKQLTLIGIPIENLAIADVNATILKTGWFSKDILSTANYILKVKDATKLKQLFEAFKKSKVHQSHIQRVSHSKLDALRKENRVTAIKAAKDKASYLLNAVGEKVGKPMIVTENTYRGDFENTLNIRSKALGTVRGFSNYGKEKSSVAFEKIKIVSTIYVKFEIQ